MRQKVPSRLPRGESLTCAICNLTSLPVRREAGTLDRITRIDSTTVRQRNWRRRGSSES